jgi:hypothetical protein
VFCLILESLEDDEAHSSSTGLSRKPRVEISLQALVTDRGTIHKL